MRPLLLLLVAACGASSAPPPAGSSPSGGGGAAPGPASSVQPGSSAAAPAPSAKPAAPAYVAKTPAEELALDLLTKRESLGWSASKKRIAYSAEVRSAGSDRSLRVGFLDLKTSKDAESWDACGRCDGLTKELPTKVPELAKKLEGFVAVSGVDVPAAGHVDVPGSPTAVAFEGGKVLMGASGAKPTKIAATLKGKAPHKPTLQRVWYVADGKLVLGRVLMDPGEKISETNAFEDLRVFPVL